MIRVVGRLVAVVLLTTAAGLAVPGAARAAACPGPQGVTVVVDHHQLGGGVDVRCDAAGGGRDAATQLTDVGFHLTYTQRQPGFVCRVDGAPASDPCVNTPPADAYWSLWWSDGKSGTWSYSSLGVASLNVPAGGYVALSWQGGNAKALPRAAARPHPTSSPSPTRTATPAPTHTAAPPPAATATPQPSATARATANPSPSGTPTLRRTAHPSALRASGDTRSHGPGPAKPVVTTSTVPASGQDSSSSSSGLPGWLAPVVVVLLFLAAGTVAVVRRRSPRGE